MVDIDDKIYIQQVLDGDTSSFSCLVDKYKDMVFTVSYRILKQQEDAEDSAQVSFMKAFNKLHSFKGDSKFSTWLYTIAFRAAIAKSKLKKVDFASDALTVDIPSEESFPQLKELQGQEQRLYVQQAIDSLPEIEGVIITLFYIDEMNIQEIIKITGLNESNVKVKLHRSRKQLKSYLENALHHEMKSII
ncbi:MAG: RNA polymerase sigma factor (sigma-70 family) [Flavobacteriaceae bacterium]|jgi:RNA polymerase sigma factor (sigma-70 family)